MIEAVGERRWPVVYQRHAIVRDAAGKGEGPVLPLAYFSDGVRYTSAISGQPRTISGVWLVNLQTQKRYWIGGMPSQDTCRCGCRGWCSVFPSMNCVSWMLGQLARGMRSPTQRDN
eukprot:830779-Pyramimonas_sp.AAC.1